MTKNSAISTPKDIYKALVNGDYTHAINHMPYYKMLGLSVSENDQQCLIIKMSFQSHLIGNPLIPALHGGTIAAMLDATGLLTVLKQKQTTLPKSINQTVNYLQSGRAEDLFASAQIIKMGRRVSVVKAKAWHEDENKPVAVMHAQYKVNS